MRPEEPGWQLEQSLWSQGYSPVAGLDEAGRGALAGPVVVAVVVLPYRQHYPFRDSKTLPAQARVVLAEEVKRVALGWALGLASAGEVDRLNVLQATHLAAGRALAQLAVGVRGLVTDYLKLEFNGGLLAPARADQISYQAAAASILAKTTRDELMRSHDQHYPGYGFAEHKGYGSPAHLRALRQHGPCWLHRQSFAPVARAARDGRQRG